MAPPLAALAPSAVVRGAALARDRATMLALVLPWTLLVTAAWQVFVHSRGVEGSVAPAWLTRTLLVGVIAAAATLVVLAFAPREWAPALASAALAIGLAALLVLPVAWTLSCVLRPVNGTLPSADVVRLFPRDEAAVARARRAADPARLTRLITFLAVNRQGERYCCRRPRPCWRRRSSCARGSGDGARRLSRLDPILTPFRAGPARGRAAGALRDARRPVVRQPPVGAEIAGRSIASGCGARHAGGPRPLARARRPRGAYEPLRPAPAVGLVSTGVEQALESDAGYFFSFNFLRGAARIGVDQVQRGVLDARPSALGQ